MKLLPHQATKQKILIATCYSSYNYKPTSKLNQLIIKFHSEIAPLHDKLTNKTTFTIPNQLSQLTIFLFILN